MKLGFSILVGAVTLVACGEQSQDEFVEEDALTEAQGLEQFIAAQPDDFTEAEMNEAIASRDLETAAAQLAAPGNPCGPTYYLIGQFDRQPMKASARNRTIYMRTAHMYYYHSLTYGRFCSVTTANKLTWGRKERRYAGISSMNGVWGGWDDGHYRYFAGPVYTKKNFAAKCAHFMGWSAGHKDGIYYGGRMDYDDTHCR